MNTYQNKGSQGPESNAKDQQNRAALLQTKCDPQWSIADQRQKTALITTAAARTQNRKSTLGRTG